MNNPVRYSDPSGNILCEGDCSGIRDGSEDYQTADGHHHDMFGDVTRDVESAVQTGGNDYLLAGNPRLPPSLPEVGKTFGCDLYHSGNCEVVTGGRKIRSNAKKKVHGNSKNNNRPSHRYVIVEGKKLFKTGISSGKLNKNKTSRRANSQINRLNRAAGYEKYKGIVVEKNKTRQHVLNTEKGVVETYFERYGEMPPGMIRPLP